MGRKFVDVIAGNDHIFGSPGEVTRTGSLVNGDSYWGSTTSYSPGSPIPATWDFSTHDWTLGFWLNFSNPGNALTTFLVNVPPSGTETIWALTQQTAGAFTFTQYTSTATVYRQRVFSTLNPNTNYLIHIQCPVNGTPIGFANNATFDSTSTAPSGTPRTLTGGHRIVFRSGSIGLNSSNHLAVAKPFLFKRLLTSAERADQITAMNAA